MNTAVTIPEGYRKDARGHLVPESTIKPIDLERDVLVQAMVNQAKQVQQAMRHFKTAAFGDIAAFVQLSAEQYDVKIGGNKGNVTLYSFDGKYKIVRQSQDSIRFDEKL
ncbi:MAG: DUF3164 family protein, partial [Acinetobacter sp.]|uniref:DUF3164 family protein n=1 Tax=Acinetobacter sp. TaxID=472 RepID=UPI003D045DC8